MTHPHDAFLQGVPQEPIPRPLYAPSDDYHGKAYLAMRDYENHTTDETWQVQIGLETAGYTLYGNGFGDNRTNAFDIAQHSNAGTMIIADRRDWDPCKSGAFDKNAGFDMGGGFGNTVSIFRVTLVKDAWHDHKWTRDIHKEMSPHAYLVYYNFDLIRKFRPWIAEDQMIRIWHSIDAGAVPKFRYKDKLDACIVSGCHASSVYPIRDIAAKAAMNGYLDRSYYHAHPGYSNEGSHSTKYLGLLSEYKVALCTSSIFGCTLRKMIEATACGCKVITDLPLSESYPVIESGFTRISSDAQLPEISDAIEEAIDTYDAEEQRLLASRTCRHYHYKRLYAQLAWDIEEHRKNYNKGS